MDNIIFMTYARLMANRDRVSQIPKECSPQKHRNSDSENALPPIGYIILDEFHRCGAAEWSRGVKALLAAWPKAKVLGLSATKLRYLDEQRDMAEELFGGNIASEMTLGEAIARGILRAPRYVVSIYRCEDEWKRYQKKVQALKDEKRRKAAEKQLYRLKRALEQAGGLETVFKKYLQPSGKYIVFCSGVTHLEEMKSHGAEWFGPICPEYRIYTVFADYSESEREFQDFKEDGKAGLRLLFCIDMLNEGIHLEDVDGVILMRPTVSPVIYKQQIGRALTAGRKNASGRQEAPLVLDIVNNFENLYSICSIEAEYEEALSEGAIRNDREERAVPFSGFQILDETHEAGKLFRQLQEKLSAGWEEYYRAAEQYYIKEGNLEVPAGYVSPSGLSLGSWILTQRRIYMGKIPGRLSREQIEKLEKLEICWESYSDRQWDQYYAQAARYYARMGNLDVKASYVTEEGFRLGMWLNNIRQYRQNGSRILSGQRQRQLEQIGMIWDKLSYKWERGYEAARRYYERHGNISVPAGYTTEEGFRLGNWLIAQRQNRRGEKKGALPLTQEQIQRLDRIGMNWEGRQKERWEQYYEAARAYFNEKGSLDVPYYYESGNGLSLGRWLYQQRASLGECMAENMSEIGRSRKERLTAIGMIWETDPWMEKWELARRYYEEHGNLNLSQSYVTEDGVWLGKWLYLQRERYRCERQGEGLTKEQISALTAIGMDWLTPGERAWENAFIRAQEYYRAYGHLDVEKGHSTEDGFRLDLWLGRQRKCHREGRSRVLSQERTARLEAIGMKW
jgi:superfamily II DNA or RNA helicase